MARFRAIFDAIPDGVIVINPAGEILDANVQAVALFGYERAEMVGQKVELLVPEKFRGGHPAKRDGYFKRPVQRPMGSGLFLKGRRKNGTLIDVEISLSPLHAPEGTLVLACIRDITERKKLEHELLQAQKLEAVGRLAGGIAHDFNNILTIVLGRAELLLQHSSLTASDLVHLQYINDAAQRATELTRQLLQFSRRGVIQPKVVDLNVLIANTSQMLRRLIGENIEISLRLEARLGKIKVDPSQVQQVIMNLMINARDAMPRGGHIILETCNKHFDAEYCLTHSDAQPGSHVMVSVTDTGEGMDAATQAHIFEPFFTTKELGKGTGLGLATVFGIVKQAGGHIFLYSEVGRGSTFKIYFPESTETVAQPVGECRTSTRGNETILLVEDEAGIRQLLHGILVDRGYTVLTAADATEAIRISNETQVRIHAMITDVVMPGMNGQELANILAKARPDMKVLFTSGYPSNMLLQQGIVDGQRAYLEKPWTPDSISRKLREVLESK